LQGYHFPPLIYLNTGQRPPGEEDIASEDKKWEMEYAESFLRVFPNPAQHELNVKWQIAGASNETVNFELFNVLGVRIGYQTEQHRSGSIVFKVDHLPSGLYFYKFTSGEGKVYSGSVQIQH
jgi:hypothetical protein